MLVLHSEGTAAAFMPPGTVALAAGHAAYSQQLAAAGTSIGSGWEQVAKAKVPLLRSVTSAQGAGSAPATTARANAALDAAGALPRDWQLLNAAGGVVHFAAVPLLLGDLRVGAMLLGWGPTKAAGGGGGSLPALMAAPTQHLEQLGECVATAGFGADTAAIGKLCLAAAVLACSASLQELAVGVMGSILDLLSAEFHVDLVAQMALVPAKSTWGVMFVEPPPVPMRAASGVGVATPAAVEAAYGAHQLPAQRQPSGPASIKLVHLHHHNTPGSPRKPSFSNLRLAMQQQQQALQHALQQQVAHADGTAPGLLSAPSASTPSMQRYTSFLPVQSLKAYPFSLASTLLNSLLQAGAGGSTRRGGVALHDCGAYLQDVTQPHGDLIFIARRSSITPASMNLVVAPAEPRGAGDVSGQWSKSASGSGAAFTGGGDDAAAAAAAAAAALAGGSRGPRPPMPCLGLYLLAGPDRLPLPLLQAIEDRAGMLLRLLLPAVHLVLCGSALEEWMYLMDSVQQPGGTPSSMHASLLSSSVGGGGPLGGAAAPSASPAGARSFGSALRAAAFAGATRAGGAHAHTHLQPRSAGDAMPHSLGSNSGSAAAALAAAANVPVPPQPLSLQDPSPSQGTGTRSQGGTAGLPPGSQADLAAAAAARPGPQQVVLPAYRPSPLAQPQSSNLNLSLGGSGHPAVGAAASQAHAHSAALAPQDDAAAAAAGGGASTPLLMTAGAETILSVLLDLPPQRESRAQHHFGSLNSTTLSALTASVHDPVAAAAAGGGASGSVVLHRGASSALAGGAASASASGALPYAPGGDLAAARGSGNANRNTWTAPVRDQMDLLVSSFRGVLASARKEDEGTTRLYADEDLRALELLWVLGRGGAGTVFAGRLHGLDVAVKLLDPVLDDPNALDQAQRQVAKQAAAAARAGRAGHATALAAPAPGGSGDAGSGGDVSAMAQQLQLRMLMRGARELAVMSMVGHPNIVQVFSYHTNIVVHRPPPGAPPSALPHLDVAPSDDAHGEDTSAPVPQATDPPPASNPQRSSAMVMEYCDLGSLADAIDGGLFFVRSPKATEALAGPPQGPPGSQPRAQGLHAAAAAAAAAGGGGAAAALALRLPNMRAIYLTLLEVALALRHLHGMRLVHCDLKPANVLLKSAPVSASDPRGFNAKLTDFGFVSMLQQAAEGDDPPGAAGGGGGQHSEHSGGLGCAGASTRLGMRFHEPVGTVTHMAPEAFIQGRILDSSLDVYSFGVLMWELYTGKAPYAAEAGSGFRDVPVKVVKMGMRPVFPPETPAQFRALAQGCWASEPDTRPTAAALVAQLQALMNPGHHHQQRAA